MREILLCVLLLSSVKCFAQFGSAPKAKDGKPVMSYVPKMPQFPRGDGAMWNYISANIHYPDSAVKKGVQGNVYISFVVNSDSTISDVRILKDIGAGCGAEAARVVQSMPKWSPGVQNGRAVNVNFNLPVDFQLPAQSPAPSAAKPANTPKAFTSVEQMPQFPGKDSGLIRFIRKNIQYPDAARKNKIQGKVYVSFIVNTDGSVSDAKITRDIGGGCGNEALRIVSIMPKWQPGMSNGKTVPVQLIEPIEFKLK